MEANSRTALIILAAFAFPALLLFSAYPQTQSLIQVAQPAKQIAITVTTSLAVAVPVTQVTTNMLGLVQTQTTVTSYSVYTTAMTTTSYTTSFYSTSSSASSTTGTTTSSTSTTTTSTGITTTTPSLCQLDPAYCPSGGGENPGPPGPEPGPPNDIGNQIDKYGWTLIHVRVTSLGLVIPNPFVSNDVVVIDKTTATVFFLISLGGVLAWMSDRRKH